MNNNTQTENNHEDQPQMGNPSQDSTEERAQDKPNREYPIAGKTEKLYQRVIKNLWEFSEDKKSQNGSLPGSESANPIDLVNDLMARDTLNQNTIITYAYALRWEFSRNRHIKDFVDAEVELTKFISQIKSTIPKQGKREGKRPKSGNSIPHEDLELLLNQLTERSGSGSSVWAGPAQRWLVAGLATGLRPGEWVTAEWIDEKHSAIRVTTSKVKVAPPGFMRDEKSESNEYVPDIKTREIPVEKDSDRFVIDVHMNTMRSYVLSGKMSFLQFQNNCGRQLALSCKAIWGNKKTYTLNSGRKQFSANMRATLGPEKTAKLLGHTRADTPAASFYGKASQAYSRTGRNYRKNNQKENQTNGAQDIQQKSAPQDFGPTDEPSQD